MPAQLIASEGPLRGLLLNLEEGEEWIVGRDPDEADFVIEDSTVSRKHARITKTPDGIFIKNLGRVNPTLVNDLPVKEATLLKEGDRVKIGNTVFLFSENTASEENELPAAKKKKKTKPKGGYDDIFGDLEQPELPPEPEPVEEPVDEIVEPPMLLEEEEVLPEPMAIEKEEPKSAYDTIFDDLAVETDMPFNLLAETPLLLKVIGGPNAGAEIGLEKGRTYLIGKDQNTCDIVFQDLSVSRNHARLIITPEGILELEDLGSKNGTMVNNAPITERRTVTSQDLIAMGTTVFLIIDREAIQETIYSPIIPSYEAPKPSEPEHTPEEVAAELAAAEEELKEEIDWKSKKIPPRYLVLAGSFAAVFLIVFLSFFSLFRSDRIDLSVKAPHDSIKEALGNFPGVHYSYNPASGKLFLTGHVLTAVNFQEMNYNLEQIPAIRNVENNVVIDELVWKSMNEVLAENAGWRGVSIVSSEPGKFVVHGYVQTADQIAQLGDYLNTNFPYLDRLSNKVVIEDVLNAQIQSLLQSQGFSVVSFQVTNGSLVLAGRYSNKQDAEFKKLLETLNKLDGVTSVKNFAVSTLPSQASIDLTQQYRVTGSSMEGRRGYNVVVNGHIVGIGEALDGMKITSIEPNSILLEKDGLKYKIDYTR